MSLEIDALPELWGKIFRTNFGRLKSFFYEAKKSEMSCEFGRVCIGPHDILCGIVTL